MQNFTSEDREMFKALYESRGKVSLYSLHERYRLSPAQLVNTINKFETMEIIIQKNEYVYLTDFGSNWLQANRKKVFFSVEKYWKTCPEGFLAPPPDDSTPYLPNFSLIDREFFKNLVEEDS